MPVYRNISIKTKLILIQLLTAFVAVFICCILFVFNDIKIFNRSQVSTRYSIAEIVGVNSVAPLLFNDKESASKILMNFSNNPSILNAVILDKNGTVFAKYDKAGSEKYTFPSASDKELHAADFWGQQILIDYPIKQDKEFLGTVMLRSEFTSLGEMIINYLKVAAAVLVGALLIAFIISAFFQQLITVRLQLLVNKSKEVSSTGNYSNRLFVSGKDEIGTLSKEFNNMLDRIEAAEASLKETNAELERRVKERTQKLERSNMELEQFAYVASHDLQEPLRTISNFVGLLEKKYPPEANDDHYRYFQFILKATTRMQNLIRDLLEISRVGRDVNFTQVDCNKVILDVLSEMQISINENNAAIHFNNLPLLIGSEVELKRVFQNLISNALKFRKKERTPEIEIGWEETSEDYIFHVTDNGIGLEEDYTNKIFNIFQRLHSTTDYPGTGIGLATCKKVIALHNGRIWVESAIDKGATFYFTISKHITSQIKKQHENDKLHSVSR